jgi:hypothetical protein
MSSYENETETDFANDATLPTTTLTTGALSHFQRLAAETSTCGAIIKFDKGQWLVGDDEITSSRRVAHVDQLARGWTKFENGKRTERRIGKVADGFEMSKREDLGDSDETQWPKDISGKVRDPWVRQYLLPLRDPDTNAIAVYVTGSIGGTSAIGALLDVFCRNVQNGLPIVRLAVGSYKHKDYGRVLTPELQVVGWTGVKDDLQDDIPF